MYSESKAALGFLVFLTLLIFFCVWRMKSKKTINPFYLYADAQPSEAVQADELPGLAVACIFPYKKGERFLDVPVTQYKEYNKRQKADRALRLKTWLESERGNGLVITGFLVSRSLHAAAKYGLDLIEELPDDRYVLGGLSRFSLNTANITTTTMHASAI